MNRNQQKKREQAKNDPKRLLHSTLVSPAGASQRPIKGPASNSSLASLAKAFALQATSSTRSSSVSTDCEARSMKLFTSSRSVAELASSACAKPN